MDILCSILYKTTHMTHTNASEDKHNYCILLAALLNGNNLSSGEILLNVIHFFSETSKSTENISLEICVG